MGSKITSKKFLILLLYAPGKTNQTNEPIYGRTRLMKMGFLFGEELRDKFMKDENFSEIILPEYFGWNYGPFSVDLLRDLEFLINWDFISIDHVSSKSPTVAELEEYSYWIDDFEEYSSKDYIEEVFCLTNEKGHDKGKEIWNELTSNQKVYLSEFKRKLNSSPLERILQYIYDKYPDYTSKSLIKERYSS